MESGDSESSVRQRIREWWRDHIEDKAEVDIKVLTDAAAAEFGQDPGFTDRFVAEVMKPVIYNIGLAVVSDLRPTRAPSQRTAKASEVATAIEGKGMDWSRWLLHDPKSGKHVIFKAMTKDQVRAASKERYARGESENRIGGFLELVAGKMRDGETVGDAWPDEQLTILVGRLIVSKPKVSLGPIGMTPIAEIMRGESA